MLDICSIACFLWLGPFFPEFQQHNVLDKHLRICMYDDHMAIRYAKNCSLLLFQGSAFPEESICPDKTKEKGHTKQKKHHDDWITAIS